MDFGHLPKVELHLHLDCSLSFTVVSALAPRVTLKEYREKFTGPAKCTNLADFLTRAQEGIKLMQTERQLRLVTRDLFDQLQKDNVIYSEIRFAPLLHTNNGLRAKDVVEIVENAAAEAIDATGIEARIILCTLRHFNESQSLETVKLVKRFQGSKVAGFDIAADEAGYPIDEHIHAFRFAFEQGIPCTAHAGEARGPESVWETMKHLRPSRLGHGVRSIEDMELVGHLRKEGIHLEVCPACNIQTNTYREYADHPINRLYELGLSVGVNTDARTITNISLTEEYQRLYNTFGWTKDHFLSCNKSALNSAFLPENTRKKLLSRLESGYHNPQ